MSSVQNDPRHQRPTHSSSSHSKHDITTQSSRSSSQVQVEESEEEMSEEWEGGGISDGTSRPAESEDRARSLGGKKRKKKDEPMSPLAVVFYVTCLYLIFQLLTRSDEHEILSHLPPSLHPPSLIPSLHPHQPNSQSQSPTYPYHIPHIPSPLPTTPSPSIYRLLLGIIIYPFYLLLQLIAIPLPLLAGILWWIIALLVNLAYPITGTTKVIWRTCVVGPWGMVRELGRLVYPIWVFVGGVIGVGLILGLGAGWVGQRIWVGLGYGSKGNVHGGGKDMGKGKVMGKEKGKKRDGKGRSTLSKLSLGTRSEHAQDLGGSRRSTEGYGTGRRIRSPSSAESMERVKTPRAARFAESEYQQGGAKSRVEGKVGRVLGDRVAGAGDGSIVGKGTGRDSVSSGVRRRSYALEDKRDRYRE